MENLELNFDDIFNLNPDDFKKDEPQKTSVYFRPDPAKGKENVYKAVVRFIPWYKDPKNKSKVKKYSYWLTDPVKNEGFGVDCPTNVGEKSILWETFWKLFKSESAAEKDLAKKFQRKENFYALVQILEDKNQPENEGKIKIWKFGKKINDKIEEELNPEYGKRRVPYDIFTGRPFLVNVKQVGDWPNYDGCKFLEEESPLQINGVAVPKTQEGLKMVIDYLQENSPNLEEITKYVAWDEATKKRIMDVIVKTVPSMRNFNNSAAAENKKEAIASAKTETIQDTGSLNDALSEIEDSLSSDNLDSIVTNDTDFDDDLYASL